MSVARAVAGLLVAVPSSPLVVAAATSPASNTFLLHSAAARAGLAGRLGLAGRAVGEGCTVVAFVLLGVFQVLPTRAVAEVLAWAGEAGRCAVRALVAVVSDLAVSAGDAAAALVLLGALVAGVPSAASTTSSGMSLRSVMALRLAASMRGFLLT